MHSPSPFTHSCTCTHTVHTHQRHPLCPFTFSLRHKHTLSLSLSHTHTLSLFLSLLQPHARVIRRSLHTSPQLQSCLDRQTLQLQHNTLDPVNTRPSTHQSYTHNTYIHHTTPYTHIPHPYTHIHTPHTHTSIYSHTQCAQCRSRRGRGLIKWPSHTLLPPWRSKGEFVLLWPAWAN